MEEYKVYKEIRECVKIRLIFFSIIGYAIGAGLVSYIGRIINPQIFWLGLIVVILFRLITDSLSCFFNLSEIYNRKKLPKLTLLRNSFLILSLSLLTIGAILSVNLYSITELRFVLWVFLGIFFTILILSAIPPFFLNKKGYGDFLNTISVVALAPSFACILQINELHRTLFLITFPVFFLLMAYFLAQSLENYFEDIKNQNHTLMTVLGWKLGMRIHNYFILLTYLLYGLGSLFGLSGILTLPAWFSLPIAGIQFWEMWRIGEGYKPRWKLLKLSSLGSISVLAYFLIFILWLR
ncbi:MAG: hypothetical protein CVU41_01645 [Chloroflexi bacterium HGW-Chloroflexi-3]|nr:MAG: hypothetical protein CVU41_01645 [Chloroflexi bacterium HGW-Chloroflexi-3]